MSTQKNEQYHILASKWLIKNKLPEDAEFRSRGDADAEWDQSSGRGQLLDPEWDLIHYIYRTRRTDLPPEAYATPPTDTTGSGREGETIPMDHVINRSAPVETQLAQAEAWIAQLQQSYRSIQQTCTNKDAQVEALRRDGERLDWMQSTERTPIKMADGWVMTWMPTSTVPLPTLRAAIDSAQRQEGR